MPKSSKQRGSALDPSGRTPAHQLGKIILPGTPDVEYRLLPFGAWSSTVGYVPGNLVTSGDLEYVCVAANTNHATTDPAYWQVFERTKSFLRADRVWAPVKGLLLGADYVPIILATPGLIAYWPLDEASGNAIDHGPNGYDLSVFGAPTYRVAGPDATRMPYGVHLAGTRDLYPTTSTDGYVSGSGALIAATLFAGRAPFTCEGWIAPSTQIEGLSGLLTNSDGGSPNHGWDFGITGSNEIVLHRDGSGNDAIQAGVLSALGYTYVVVKYDGTTVTIYYDADPQIAAASAASVAGGGAFMLGLAPTLAGSHGVHYQGDAAHFAIYNVALDDETIREHFAAASGVAIPGGVTSVVLADGAVTTPKIADAAVSTVKIADAAVTSAKIADGSIVNADVSPTAALALSKLAGYPADASEVPLGDGSWGKAPITSPIAEWAGPLPTKTGPGLVFRVPFVRGVSATFTLSRIFSRLEVLPAGSVVFRVEKSSGGGAFTPTTIATLTHTTSDYEKSNTSLSGTVQSGDLVRIFFVTMNGRGGAYQIQLQAEV
jgi:hypothetical protein